MNKILGHPENDPFAKALTEELANRPDLLPPWRKYPEIPRYSIGWRMGSGEFYLMVWDRWAKRLNRKQRTAYFKNYTPIPVEWVDWVASSLGHGVLTEMMAGKDNFKGIQWLEEQGLASLAEFRIWYQEFWKKSFKE